MEAFAAALEEKFGDAAVEAAGIVAETTAREGSQNMDEDGPPDPQEKQ